MEETIQLFKSFLAHIAWAQNSLDQCRSLICEYPQAKVDLFKVLDQEQKGYITPEDICQFYGEKSNKFPKGAYSIVERYFRFNEGSLTLDEFSTVLESKKCHVVTPEADENPVDVFHHMIAMAIEYYIEIEKVRVRLCCEAENLQKYFCYHYHVKNCLTKSALRSFMHQYDHYTKQKFDHICSYIFGDATDQIPWVNLLQQQILCSQNQSSEILENKKQIKQEQNNYMQDMELQYEDRQEIVEKKPEYPERKTQSHEINDLLNQIDSIERTLKDRKSKRNYSELAESLNKEIKFAKEMEIKFKRTGSNFEGKRQTGMIKSNRPQVNANQPDFSLLQKKYPKYTKPSYKQNFLTQGNSQNWDAYKLQLKQNVWREDPMPRAVLHKSSTEAQLKIQQIQKRALNKYMIEKNNSPKPHYQPYRAISKKFYDYSCFSRPNSPVMSPISSPRTKHPEVSSLRREMRHYDIISRSPRLTRY